MTIETLPVIDAEAVEPMSRSPDAQHWASYAQRGKGALTQGLLTPRVQRVMQVKANQLKGLETVR